MVNHDVNSYLGKMNIFVAPQESGTVFEVNTSYAFSMVTTGRDEKRNLIGRVIDSDYLQPLQASFRFTTKAPAEEPFGPVTVQCQATGIWEQLILDLARDS